jgi:hypothetical protein
MPILGIALGTLVGLSLGMLGGGGAILTVPIFVYVLGFGPREAIAMSLAVVGMVSLVGAAGHWRAGNTDLRLALSFGVFAMTGSYLGTRLAHFVSEGTQLTLFALVMLVAAGFMFRRRPAGDESVTAEPRRLPLGLLAAQALAVGMVTGLVGVGGGFMIVPALVLLGRVPMKRAVGTSLLVITMNSAAGFAGYLGRVDVAWGVLAAFAAAAVGGILVGTRLSRSVPQAALQRAFAVFLVVMGTFILYQNRGVVLPHATNDSPATAARH